MFSQCAPFRPVLRSDRRASRPKVHAVNGGAARFPQLVDLMLISTCFYSRAPRDPKDKLTNLPPFRAFYVKREIKRLRAINQAIVSSLYLTRDVSV